MDVFFQLVIIAFLLLIAIELLLIYRELVHSQVLRNRWGKGDGKGLAHRIKTFPTETFFAADILSVLFLLVS